MKSLLTIRHADLPFVEAVTHWVIGDEDKIIAAPDGCWDLVVLKQEGSTHILLTGQTTHAVPLPFTRGDEITTISFKASAFLSLIPAAAILDRGILLPTTGGHFQLACDVFEIPTFDNAEGFVQKLMKQEHIHQDDVVDETLRDHPPAYSPRSIQRRFLRATGMTHNDFRQIRRARLAAALLQKGIPAVEAALETGYADQSHMSRSLKRILGRTPTEIAILKNV